MKLPLGFEPNVGQSGSAAEFLLREGGMTAQIRPGCLTLFPPPAGGEALDSSIRMTLVNASPRASVEGARRLEGYVNYLIGGDQRRWKTNVPTFGQVLCHAVYPGVDVLYHDESGRLEYDFVLERGTDIGSIRLAFEGIDRMDTDRNGDILLFSRGAVVQHGRPRVFQMIGGERREIEGNFVRRGQGEIGFDVRGMDRSIGFAIDPEITYATYLGGNDVPSTSPGAANGIAIDSLGNVFLTGGVTIGGGTMGGAAIGAAVAVDVVVTLADGTSVKGSSAFTYR